MNEKSIDIILDLMAERISDNDTRIKIMGWEIEDLKRKLAEAEKYMPKKCGIETRTGSEGI